MFRSTRLAGHKAASHSRAWATDFQLEPVPRHSSRVRVSAKTIGVTVSNDSSLGYFDAQGGNEDAHTGGVTDQSS